MTNGDAEADHQNVTPNVGASRKPLLGKSTVIKTVSASKPSMFNSGSKASGGGLFKKPGMMGLGKKKFQLDVAAPSENEVQQIQKVEAKLLAPKMMTVKKMEGGSGASGAYLNPPDRNTAGLSRMSLNQASNASLHEKRVKDDFVRPMALKEKT